MLGLSRGLVCVEHLCPVPAADWFFTQVPFSPDRVPQLLGTLEHSSLTLHQDSESLSPDLSCCPTREVA